MISRQRRRASLPFRLAHRDPVPGSVAIPLYVVRKLEARVVRAGENECWPYVPDRPFRPVDVPEFTPDPDRHHQIAWRDPKTNVRLTIPTHRLALIVESGPISPDLQAYHLCARSHRCCNPRHLYAGTSQQRAQDRVLLHAIEAAQGTTEGIVLPPHPRSRMVCEALINGEDPASIIEREQRRLDPPSQSLPVGSCIGASDSFPSRRLRPARERTAQIR